MAWVRWSDVDRFGEPAGFSRVEAHRLNQDPLIQAKREEYALEFDAYEEPLRRILYGSSSQVAGALIEVPNDVLMAFFGVFGPEVLRVKARTSGGIVE